MIDWPLAIERNREALLRIVELLFAMAGLTENVILGLDPRTATLPRHLRNRVLRILRPAESAVRRLIVIAARGISVTPRPSGERKGPPPTSVILGFNPKTSGTPSSLAKTSGARSSLARIHSVKPAAATNTPSFPLVDPRKRFDLAPRRRYAKSFPRISIIGVTEPRPIPDILVPSPDDEVGAARICRRLAALKRALEDLDGQARRLACRSAREARGGARRLPPMRPGWPPGHRRRPRHEVDDVLRECHSLARAALDAPDTS